MRSLAIDSRKFQLLTTVVPNNAMTGGVPVSTSWLTGDAGPDGLPVWRTQMADPTPASGWSWGSHPGYRMPALPAGQRLRIYWWMRGTNKVGSRRIARVNGTESTNLGNIADSAQWALLTFDVILAYASTVDSHQIRRSMDFVPGGWVEMTPPLIEIV